MPSVRSMPMVSGGAASCPQLGPVPRTSSIEPSSGGVCRLQIIVVIITLLLCRLAASLGVSDLTLTMPGRCPSSRGQLVRTARAICSLSAELVSAERNSADARHLRKRKSIQRSRVTLTTSQRAVTRPARSASRPARNTSRPAPRVRGYCDNAA